MTTNRGLEARFFRTLYPGVAVVSFLFLYYTNTTARRAVRAIYNLLKFHLFLSRFREIVCLGLTVFSDEYQSIYQDQCFGQ